MLLRSKRWLRLPLALLLGLLAAGLVAVPASAKTAPWGLEVEPTDPEPGDTVTLVVTFHEAIWTEGEMVDELIGLAPTSAINVSGILTDTAEATPISVTAVTPFRLEATFVVPEEGEWAVVSWPLEEGYEAELNGYPGPVVLYEEPNPAAPVLWIFAAVMVVGFAFAAFERRRWRGRRLPHDSGSMTAGGDPEADPAVAEALTHSDLRRGWGGGYGGTGS